METHSPEGVVDERATLTTASIDDLPDSAFAYIEPGGKKDEGGLTVPRSLRHYPIQDKAHADDALARANAAASGDDATAKEIAEKALPKIKEAVARFDKQSNSAEIDAEHREDEPKPDKHWATPKRHLFSMEERPPSHEANVEIRMDAGEGEPIAMFVGYASTTGIAYEVRDWLGEYRETIMPGAFAKTLREQKNVPLLFNHDGVPLASTESGTSRLAEDKVGLRNEADLDRRDALTNSICVQLQRGVLNKMSFSFRAIQESWDEGYMDRGVSEAALYDSSIVTYPANPTTSGELQDAFRSAMGGEGQRLWLADYDTSVRTALPFLADGERDSEHDDLLERALRALAHADEVVTRSANGCGRARTFRVAQTILDLRAGKKLSAKNEQLLTSALSALSAADRQHQKLADSHAKAADAVSAVLDDAAPADGMGGGTPPGSGDPIMPKDGAGPRSLPPSVLAARRQLDRLKLAK